MAFTATEVAKHLGMHPTQVRRNAAPGKRWHEFVASTEPLTFTTLDPPMQEKQSVETPAQLVSALGGLLVTGLKDRFSVVDAPEPPADANNLMWAIYWGCLRRIPIFPCDQVIGLPIEHKTKPTTDADTIAGWWQGEDRNADIACWPDRSGMFVVEVNERRQDPDPLNFSDGCLFQSLGEYGTRRFWYAGRAYTKLHALGQWCHVIGIGEMSFLHPSATIGLISL